MEIPPVPFLDPADALLVDPSLAESRRFCSHCREPVGQQPRQRRRAGAVSRVLPALRSSVLVRARASAGRLRRRPVRGCRMHRPRWHGLDLPGPGQERLGPMGGLERSARRGDESDGGRNRRTPILREVEHPNIVKIYNFVQHDDSGYIVMSSRGRLAQVLTAIGKRQGNPAPSPRRSPTSSRSSCSRALTPKWTPVLRLQA